MEDAKWYAVHTYSGYENKVAENIMKVVNNRNMQDEILEVDVPIDETKIAVKKRQKKTRNSEEDKYYGFVRQEDSEYPSEDESAADSSDGEGSYEKIIRSKRFPGYVFVKFGISYDRESKEMKMTDEAWYVVRNTRGVTGFVGPESKPRPLSAEEAEFMGLGKSAETPAEQLLFKVDFVEGDTVRIISGGYKGQQGTVDSVDLKNGTVRVLVTLGGREVPATISINFVERVEY